MAAPDLSNITENDKTLYDSVINKLRIGGDIGVNETRFIGPDAEKVLVYRDENGDIIRKLEPEGQEEPIVVGSIEGAASTLGKLEEKDKDLDTDILETKKIFVNANSIEPNNKAIYTHNVDDFIIYNNNTTPIFAKVIKRINIDDTITNTGSNANVQNETMTDEIKAMKESSGTMTDEIDDINDEIDEMKKSFQAGVDAVYQACVAEGVRPSASTPTAIAQAISTIRNGGNAGAAQILSGYNAYSNKQLRNGSMVNRGAWSDTGTGRSNVIIPQGYHNGSGYVNGVGKWDDGHYHGVIDADNRANPDSANYRAGRDQGRADTTGHTLSLSIVKDWDDDTAKIVLEYDGNTELIRVDTYQQNIHIPGGASRSIKTSYFGIS